ncbi:MAG TPA: thioredoxin [Natrialbaceae archaeon]|nr:thioredoxin [Natrialbaceae archaeon]
MTTTEAKEQTDSQPSTDEPIHVHGQDDLDALAAEHDVVLADFYADWCGPCKALEPIVANIAADTETVVAKVDVDENQELAAEYGVRGVPTMALFAGGEMAERLVGLRDEDTLRQLIDQHK